MSQVQTAETDSQRVSRAVIDAVAAVEGIRPTELAPPLYDVVDPDALDKVFAGRSSLGKVVFNYNSYEVTVDADGHVAIKDYSG
ncbi:HalOD1 output domain-containing protein [Halosimplex sp. TS25]|uniref:HalOD1 output domain-containing protein n=1 Tax=Halosimplex rarum TaxID=3396619 RepID=UPI0039E810EC